MVLLKDHGWGAVVLDEVASGGELKVRLDDDALA